MLNGLTKAKKVVLDIFTFSYPKYRIFTVAGVLLILFIVPVSFLESMPNLSICSHVLGKYCYSVGITRGVSSLLKGNLSQALNYNILAMPVFFGLILLIAYDLLVISNKRGA
jgi:hypothetical protein